jgi:ATP-dependent helicase YprA (DUF1998 family)
VTKIIDTKGVLSFGNVLQRYYNWTYKKIKNSKVLSEHECHLPDIEINTPALWINLSDSLINTFRCECSLLLDDLLTAIHTLSHAFMSVAPTIFQCSSNEIKSEHKYSEGFPHR